MPTAPIACSMGMKWAKMSQIWQTIEGGQTIKLTGKQMDELSNRQINKAYKQFNWQPNGWTDTLRKFWYRCLPRSYPIKFSQLLLKAVSKCHATPRFFVHIINLEFHHFFLLLYFQIPTYPDTSLQVKIYINHFDFKYSFYIFKPSVLFLP